MRVVGAAWLALLALGVGAEIAQIPTDAAFESDVLMSSRCHAVLFSSAARDMPGTITLAERLEAALPGLAVSVADVDDVKAVSSEFNVRKRMLPRLLLFNSRARQPSVVKLKGEGGEAGLSLESLTAAVRAELVENGKDADGKYEKLTLAIGSGHAEL